MYDEFEALDVAVIAVAQEDKDLASHAKMGKRFDPPARFEIVADLERDRTRRYERTSTYLIDRDGVVQQVFPQVVHFRAAWGAILPEIRRRLDAPARESR
jgi:peroxiredoxin